MHLKVRVLCQTNRQQRQVRHDGIEVICVCVCVFNMCQFPLFHPHSPTLGQRRGLTDTQPGYSRHIVTTRRTERVHLHIMRWHIHQEGEGGLVIALQQLTRGRVGCVFGLRATSQILSLGALMIRCGKQVKRENDYLLYIGQSIWPKSNRTGYLVVAEDCGISV